MSLFELSLKIRLFISFFFPVCLFGPLSLPHRRVFYRDQNKKFSVSYCFLPALTMTLELPYLWKTEEQEKKLNTLVDNTTTKIDRSRTFPREGRRPLRQRECPHNQKPPESRFWVPVRDLTRKFGRTGIPHRISESSQTWQCKISYFSGDLHNFHV